MCFLHKKRAAWFILKRKSDWEAINNSGADAIIENAEEEIEMEMIMLSGWSEGLGFKTEAIGKVMHRNK